MSLRVPHVSLALALGFLGCAVGLRAQTLIGPTAYLSFADSPFNALSVGGGFTYFQLETFEDGLLNTPGVSASTGVIVAPGSITDSVDADDGIIDGSGNGGHSWFGGGTVTFTFSAATLGALPTHAGIVWTDGPNPTFEAFDALGNSLGTLVGTSADGFISGETAEDRFFGVINLGGISKISITAGSWEVDHLQYGQVTAIPEPASCATLAGAAILLFAAMRRRRNEANA